MATCDNDAFLRNWWEVSSSKRADPIAFPYGDSVPKWVPYNKGGVFRKWAGNDEKVVNWENGGAVLEAAGAVMGAEELRFKEMATWSRVSSGVLAVRMKEPGFLFDMTGPAAFGGHQDLLRSMAFLNSSVGKCIAHFMSPSIDFQPGQIGAYPLLDITFHDDAISDLAERSCSISRSDWDSVETSWSFACHPMIEELKGKTMSDQTNLIFVPVNSDGELLSHDPLFAKVLFRANIILKEKIREKVDDNHLTCHFSASYSPDRSKNEQWGRQEFVKGVACDPAGSKLTLVFPKKGQRVAPIEGDSIVIEVHSSMFDNEEYIFEFNGIEWLEETR